MEIKSISSQSFPIEEKNDFKILNEKALEHRGQKDAVDSLVNSYCDSPCTSDIGCPGDRCGMPE